jgi:tetratricopeptide (TPR) repeat protein
MQNSLENPSLAMQQAQARAQAGDLQGAAQICRALLERAPANVYALFMLGTIEGEFKRYEEAARLLGKAVELKRHAEAIEALNKAIALQPQNPNALIYRGLGLAETGKPEAALKDFDRVLSIDPRSVFALHNRANALLQLNRHDEARKSVDVLLRIAPNHILALINLVTILLHEKKHDEALRLVDRALALEPDNPALWNARGQVLYQLKRYNDAFANYGKAIQLRPDCAEFYLSRGNLQADLQRYDAALESFEQAIALNPELAPAYLSSANILMEQQRLEDALGWCEKSIAAKPDYAPAILLKGNILLHLGRRSEAFASFDAAVAAGPDYHEAHYHRGSAKLLTGRFAEGWRDFEHRWQVADCGFDRPVLQAPEWCGEPLKERSIVVYSEQGMGDTIQFARFLPRLVRAGAKLTFLCHANLIRLVRSFARDMEIVPAVEGGRRFDFQCALMSLPLHLGVGLETVPNETPYLFAEDELVAKWRARIKEEGFKIGLCWQGNPAGKIDKGRSIPLEKYGPLAAVPGVRLISLQKNHGLDQLDHLPAGMKVETLGAFDSADNAFVDTAAIMQNLDLVITSDTAIPHLAGALNRPAWVALKEMPDWRWMVERSDSPWYKSLRLFRQPAPGDWDAVFAAMANELHALMRRDS